MKILVTGGAGFIGSHLCERLLGEAQGESGGHQVFCVDNLSTGSMENIRHLLDGGRGDTISSTPEVRGTGGEGGGRRERRTGGESSGRRGHDDVGRRSERRTGGGDFIFIEHDITLSLPAVVSEMAFDRIYHLASPASPVDYKKMPIETLWVNAAGTKNVLDLAVQARANLLFASTSEVYGDPAVHPQTEEYFGNVNPVGERSCYDEGKRFAESLVSAYTRKYGLTASIVRIFNTYGPRMRKNDGRAIPEFIARAIAGAPLKISGDGSQTRSFCYIDDMINGIVAAMGKPGIYNLGNPEEITIRELAEKIVRLTGSSSMIEYTEKEKDDPMRRKPDITRAKKLLGFEIKTNLEDGLKNTISAVAS